MDSSTSTWTSTLIAPDASIREAIETIDQAGLQIALVVDEARRLKGVVTDGDIRRGILKGISLEGPIQQVMNPNPVTVDSNVGPEATLVLMRRRRLHQIPVIDAQGIVVDLRVIDELLQPPRLANWVVLMAGGLGRRLRPLTDDLPKPLIKVGDRPVLERILDILTDHGFHRFYVSVNYKADMIRDYLGDGSRWNCHITYVQEKERRGTAGALSLLPTRPSESFLVMNTDLITNLHFQQLLSFHREHDAVATLCVRLLNMQIPYGVIETDDHRVVQIQEKPVRQYFANAGIYVLEPEALDFVPGEGVFDMTELFQALIETGRPPVAFPIREYWTDIGKPEDLQQATEEVEELF